MSLSLSTLRYWRSPGMIPPVRNLRCRIQQLLDDGRDNFACELIDRRQLFFGQHRVSAFRPRGDAGPWAQSVFCAACAGLQHGCESEVFLSLPWAVSWRYQAVPVDGRGPLMPTHRFRPVWPLPDAWENQADALSRCIRSHETPETKVPSSVPLELLAANIASQTGQPLLPGVLLLVFLRAGYSFGVSGDGRETLVTVRANDSLQIADALVEAIYHNHEPCLVQ